MKIWVVVVSLKRKEELSLKIESLKKQEDELRTKWNNEKDINNKIKEKKIEIEKNYKKLSDAENNYNLEGPHTDAYGHANA